jgi:hypothetical protein
MGSVNQPEFGINLGGEITANEMRVKAGYRVK